jgi:hypothetical protein
MVSWLVETLPPMVEFDDPLRRPSLDAPEPYTPFDQGIV